MKKLMTLTATFIFNIVPVAAQEAGIPGEALEGLRPQELGIRFAIDILAIFILFGLIFYRRHHDKNFLFTLIILNLVNFVICYMLNGANMEIGFAFGLFAIFSVMRFRTETIPVKNMGYLFLSVAMGLVNSLATVQENYIILLVTNTFIILLAYFLESATTDRVPLMVRDIIYERIDLIKPGMQNEMIRDLRLRTGLAIQSVNIINIDFMQDVALIQAYYTNENSGPMEKIQSNGQANYNNRSTLPIDKIRAIGQAKFKNLA